MTTAALIAAAKRLAEPFGKEAREHIALQCEMLLACEKRTTTSTAAVHYRSKLEQFIRQQETVSP